MAEAKSLLKRSCSAKQNRPLKENNFAKPDSNEFHILPHDPTSDLHTLQRLADDLDSYSPLVGLETDTDKPDCIFLEITGLAHLFQGESNIELAVHEHCIQLGYVPETAIADTVGLSWGMVKCGAQHLLSKQLPIHSLRLLPTTFETLSQLGIQTVGQLQQLPRRDLTARFGDEICKRLDQMAGKIAEPIIARRPPPEYYAEQLLNAPTSHRETIEVIIQRLIEQICNELSAAQRGALQWTFRLYCGTPLPMKFQVSLFQASATAKHVFQLALMQLEQLFRPTRKNRMTIHSNLLHRNLD